MLLGNYPCINKRFLEKVHNEDNKIPEDVGEGCTQGLDSVRTVVFQTQLPDLWGDLVEIMTRHCWE